MKGIVLSLFLFLSLNTVFSQIQTGNDNPKTEDKKEKVKEVKDTLETEKSKSSYYMTYSFMHAFRDFEDASVYGIYYRWNDQQPIKSGGFNFGTYIPLTKNLELELGATWYIGGDEYNFKDSLSDSSYHEVNKYRHIGVPIKLRYVYGNDFKFFAFAGITPVNLINIRRDSDYVTESGAVITNPKNIIKNNFSAFNLTASAGLGVSWNLGDFGFILYPEYRRHLLNSYDVLHVNYRQYQWMVNFGIVFDL